MLLCSEIHKKCANCDVQSDDDRTLIGKHEEAIHLKLNSDSYDCF